MIAHTSSVPGALSDDVSDEALAKSEALANGGSLMFLNSH
jgi:hypothetical protein